MNKLKDLHTLVRLLREFEFPVSPILEYAIKEKEEELRAVSSEMDFPSEELTVENFYATVTPESSMEGFRNYLFKTKAERTAYNYLRCIDKPIRAYIAKLIEPKADSVYSFQTASEVRAIIVKLKADMSFVEDNQKWHNALTAALSSYLKFLESKDNI